MGRMGPDALHAELGALHSEFDSVRVAHGLIRTCLAHLLPENLLLCQKRMGLSKLRPPGICVAAERH